MNAAPKGAAVFLDRDGTLIREVHYLSQIGQIDILPGVAAALRQLRLLGFKLVMVTNQSVVARGALSEAGLREIHAEIAGRLARDGARLDAVYYCPHHPTEGLGAYRIDCACRKPKPGMIRRAAAELQIDPALSFMVGDQLIDMELAEAVGASGILVGQDDVMAGARLAGNFRAVADLSAAAAWIAERLGLSE
jgi:D-glycero-D-manno-heptose 1,7-bisphosphate phosphatase